MQGRSLVPLLRGEASADWRESIYYHYYEYPSSHMVPRHNGIRTARYKLMHFYQFDEWEFCDLATDPDEQRNRHHDPAFAGLISECKQRLIAPQDHYEDDRDMSVKPESWQREVRMTDRSYRP